MITDDTLTIAIASDLHAFLDPESDGFSPSHLQVAKDEGIPGQNPIAGLLELIRKFNLQADLLLCPGDMGDKACPEAIDYVWKAMHSIKNALNASLVVATTGNHDVDSRKKYNSYDPTEVLKCLIPPYPFSEGALNDKYWARNFALLSCDNYRLAVVNSSAYQGTDEKEQLHGRISDRTLFELKTELLGSYLSPINILLCHHHPQQHSELKLGDYDAMTSGQQLLDILGSGELGRWLVIHGHKHHPKITYASGGSSSPVIFSAGSLCAHLYLQLGTACRNQFYILRLDRRLIAQRGLVGDVTAWDWAFGKGWAEAAETSGIPHKCGFGYRGDIFLLAKRISSTIGQNVMEWDQLLDPVPELAFILPQDLIFLTRYLESEFGIRILQEKGLPKQIGQKI